MLGKRKPDQQHDLFIATGDLAKAPAHVFYDQLNQLLAQHGFDAFVEKLCAPFYQDGGRPGLPPGIYFRMLFIGYFEGIDSQRGIDWRCQDSLSLRKFLGVPLTEPTPDHSTLSMTRRRLDPAVFEQVFGFVLGIAEKHGLLQGKTLAVDSTMLEANAAMKSIVRKDTGEDYHEWLKKVAAAEGLENPTAAQLQRFDRQRKDKSCSNEEWESPHDPDARIGKMKDGRTHLAYKAEHGVDLDSGLLVSARVLPADAADSATLADTVIDAQIHLVRAESEVAVTEVAADKGYHAQATLAACHQLGVRTYVPEKELPVRKDTGRRRRHRWSDGNAEGERIYRNNRRRTRGDKGKRLGRLRSEYAERSFAHVCDTGGARRCWIRGRVEIGKRYLMGAAAFNLATLLRKLFGLTKPRGLQDQAGTACAAFFGWISAFFGLIGDWLIWRAATDRATRAAA
jgi:transposase